MISNLLSDPVLFDEYCSRLGHSHAQRRSWVSQWLKENVSEQAYQDARAAASGQCAVEAFRVIELLARTIESMREK